MKLLHLAALLASSALTAGCTTPPPAYTVSERQAADQKAASLLLIETTNSKMAERFAKSSSPPKLLNAVAPEMSRAAVNHGGMGTVRVEVSVAKTGRVTEVKVLESPNEYLSEDVSRALSQWIFTPLIVNGEPKDFKFRQPYVFRLGS